MIAPCELPLNTSRPLDYLKLCKDKHQDHQGEKSWRGLLYEIDKLEEEKDLSKAEASDETQV
jgi:hypothetical protein